MFIQHLIKRSFPPNIWNRGSLAFRNGLVSDVAFKRPWVQGKVKTRNETSTQHSVTFKLERQGLKEFRCSCFSDPFRKNFCEHLAALVIWWMAKGSLLRAGIEDSAEGATQFSSENTVEKKESTREKTVKKVPTVEAQPVCFIHLITRDDNVRGVSLEPALRYRDPIKKKDRTEVLRALRQEGSELKWKSIHGLTLTANSQEVPFVQSLFSSRITHMGSHAVQFLGRIFDSPVRSRVVFDEELKVSLDPSALKLSYFEIGPKIDGKRHLKFKFENKIFSVDSEELKTFAAEGRLSHDYLWADNTIYKFEMSLAYLARHINQSGINVLETIGMKPLESLVELEDDRDTPLHPLTVLRLSMELGATKFVVDPSWAEFHVWKKNFERKTPPKLPKTDYGFELRDYQKNGLSWLWSLYNRGLSAFLADDMGLGKTHQVLALLSTLYRQKQNRPQHPSIVVAPTSVVAAWKQKLDRYNTGLKWHIYHGSARELPQADKADLIITTYGVLQRDKILRDCKWHMAIADESQTIKNANTATSRISRALNADFRIAMTGTPVENSATDLWSAMDFLLPGYLGSQARFKRLYNTRGDALSSEKATLVKKLVSPFLLRRTKSQVLTELPEKIEEVTLCEFTPQQRQVYNAYLQSQEASKIRVDLQTGQKIDYTGILALLTKLKQVCDHPYLPELTAQNSNFSATTVDPLLSGKWEALEEIITEALNSNLKVVVFTQFLAMLDILKTWLNKNNTGFAELRGDTKNREAVISRFNNDPDCRVFVGSLMAGGLGIDLTAASVCIHFDRWWNPARENQATDRLHRIGQTRGVQVFKFQCPGTIEDRIARIIQKKVALSSSLIEDSSLGLKSFSRDELLSLLTELAQTSNLSSE